MWCVRQVLPVRVITAGKPFVLERVGREGEQILLKPRRIELIPEGLAEVADILTGCPLDYQHLFPTTRHGT